MKPVLLIDFDGTLCADRFWAGLDEDVSGRIEEFIFNDGDLLNGWMRGDYDSERICEIISRGLGIEYNILWDSLLESCRAMRVSADDLRKIDLLRNRYLTAIVTVNMDCFDRFIVPALGLDKHFDCIINSCNEGVFKIGDSRENRGGLLEVAIAKTGAVINGSILIDDSEKNCEAFIKIGGRGLKVDSDKPLNYWLDEILSLL